MSNNVTEIFETEHFIVDGSIITTWNKNKISLPEGAGVKFIAPTDLVATLKEPFEYDWSQETNGLLCRWHPVTVYGEEWVGKQIRHFPYCKELLEINEWLKQYGWSIPVSWGPIVKSLHKDPMVFTSDSALKGIRDSVCLKLSGYIAENTLERFREEGYYLSTAKRSDDYVYSLQIINKYSLCVDCYERNSCAQSVRCVSYEPKSSLDS